MSTVMETFFLYAEIKNTMLYGTGCDRTMLQQFLKLEVHVTII